MPIAPAENTAATRSALLRGTHCGAGAPSARVLSGAPPIAAKQRRASWSPASAPAQEQQPRPLLDPGKSRSAAGCGTRGLLTLRSVRRGRHDGPCWPEESRTRATISTWEGFVYLARAQDPCAKPRQTPRIPQTSGATTLKCSACGSSRKLGKELSRQRHPPRDRRPKRAARSDAARGED